MWRNWTILPPLRRGLLTSRLREFQARAMIEQGWKARAGSLRLGCDDSADVVISLTSHAQRFATLAPTLRSLLLQDMRPAAVVLWIAHHDIAALPGEVLELCKFGLTIEPCEDHGPHTKYAHALRRFSGHAIAICDDDTYYPPDWLSGLVAGERSGEMPCYRMHRVARGSDGLPLGYNLWSHDSDRRDTSRFNFPTGVGGVLLRRNRFDPAVLDIELARRLCPTTDDVWLYVTALMAGTRFRLIGDHVPLTVWRSSQFSALWKRNVLEHGNDASMQAVIAHFGAERIFAATRDVLAA